MNQYKNNFDHLGQMTHGDHMPWTAADLMIVVLFVLSLIGIITGVLR